MEVVDGMQAGKRQGGWSHVGRCRSTSRVRGDTLMNSDHAVVKMRSSGRVEPEVMVFLERLLHGTPREGSGSLSMLSVYSTQ